MEKICQCTVRDLAQRLRDPAQREQVTVLDVREPWERELAAIGGSLHICMDDVPERLDDIRSAQGDGDLIVHCHTGRRSMTIARFLQQNGFARVFNLAGGIDAWTQQIDDSAHLY